MSAEREFVGRPADDVRVHDAIGVHLIGDPMSTGDSSAGLALVTAP